LSTASAPPKGAYPAGPNRVRREYHSKPRLLIKYLSLQRSSKQQKKTGCTARYDQSLSQKMAT
jgi:hypothetical protein